MMKEGGGNAIRSLESIAHKALLAARMAYYYYTYFTVRRVQHSSGQRARVVGVKGKTSKTLLAGFIRYKYEQSNFEFGNMRRAKINILVRKSDKRACLVHDSCYTPPAP